MANTPLHGRVLRDIVPRVHSKVQEELPEYMWPSSYVILDRLPVTVRGKLDQAALPPPEMPGSSTGGPYIPPRSVTEIKLASVWRRVLGTDRIGVDNNFFTDLGGHSLIATQVVSRVRELFEVDLPLRTIFESPTLVSLAAEIDRRIAGGGPRDDPIRPVPDAQRLDPTALSEKELDAAIQEFLRNQD